MISWLHPPKRRGVRMGSKATHTLPHNPLVANRVVFAEDHPCASGSWNITNLFDQTLSVREARSS